MDQFEKVCYEASPAIFISYAGAVMIFSNKIASAFAFLLVAVSFLIIFLRIKFRLAPPPPPNKADFIVKRL